VWTIDELVDRVRAALAVAEYPGAPNGRVQGVPDRRAIRWYATTGIVDRPTAMRGRVALYGPRHLLQLVAVKRRQAEGRTLAEIQAELTGATDADLAAIAAVPERFLALGDAPADATPVRPRFWATTPAGTPAPSAALAAAGSPVAAPPPRAVPAGPAAPASTAALVDAADGHAAHRRRIDVASTLAGVPLEGGALLLLPAHPHPDDLPAITAAAQPLLDLLAARGLLDATDRST
jgi:DNA-binding transcriptional MerR regulator